MPAPATLRDAALFVAERYLGVPYRWGGDDPLDGVDCSGLVIEMLAAVGLVPRELDTTAGGLLEMFEARRTTSLKPGMLVFWPSGGGRIGIRHVEIVWAVYGDRILTIGASGGGPGTVDRPAAVRSNSFVKIRRITPGWIAAVDPFP